MLQLCRVSLIFLALTTIVKANVLPLVSSTMVRGSNSDFHTLFALDSLDQQDYQDDRDRYIEINPDEFHFCAKFDFLWDSTDDDSSSLTEIIVSTNSMGSAYETQVRYFKIFNYSTNSWVTIGDNRESPGWRWHRQQFAMESTRLGEFVSPHNFVSIRFESANAHDAANLDFLQVKVFSDEDPSSRAALQRPGILNSNSFQEARQASRYSDDCIRLPISDMTIRKGSLLGDQTFEVLNDAKGNEAGWNDYIEILPEDPDNFVVDFEFDVNPPDEDYDVIQGIAVNTNSKGPQIALQERTVEIYNHDSSTWQVLGNNQDARHWEWTQQVFQISDTTTRSYTGTGRSKTPRRLNEVDGSSVSASKVKIRYQSNTSYDVCDLDAFFITLCSIVDENGIPISSVPSSSEPYKVLSAGDLPPLDLDVAINNPLKGFMTSSRWVRFDDQVESIPSSLDFHYIGLDTTMVGPNTFDWSLVDSLLENAANCQQHVVFRFIMENPHPNDVQHSRVPDFLVDQGLGMFEYQIEDSGKVGLSPNYSSPLLLDALHDFIFALGHKLDGDARVGFIQVGLLGFWGGWHTYTGGVETNDWIPEHTKRLVAGWYSDAFVETPLQGPMDPIIADAGFGLYVGSFAKHTLSDTTGWFFWPKVERAGYTDFWEHGAFGGELAMGLQEIAFSEEFPFSGNEYEQDFNECTRITHATYMVNNFAFQPPGYTGPGEIDRLLDAAKQMGYNFQVTEVSATSNGATSTTDTVGVTIKQVGIAPFYYPLSLRLSCDGATKSWEVTGVETIARQGDTKQFSFDDIPADSACLTDIELSLVASRVYEGNPVRFAQGDGTVHVSFGPRLA